MGKMSRDKGKRGELEVAELMKAHGFEARRGRQYQGGPDAPDVVHNIPHVHAEVKRRESLSLYPVLEQTKQEAAGEVPVVFHRRSDKPWVVIMYADDFLNTMEAIRDGSSHNLSS